MSQELRNPESQLRQQIAIDKEKILEPLVALRDKVSNEVEPHMTNLQSMLRETERKLHDHAEDVVALVPSLTNLKNLTQQYDLLAAATAGIRTNETKANSSVLAAACTRHR